VVKKSNYTILLYGFAADFSVLETAPDRYHSLPFTFKIFFIVNQIWDSIILRHTFPKFISKMDGLASDRLL
jgi:hypothetical protein